MALKRSTLSASSGSSSAASSDFIISIGSSGYTTTTLSQDFPVGSYIVTSALGDSTYDVYLLTSAGANAGNVSTSTASTSIIASAAFNKVVVYGATNNDTLTFQFKYVFAPSADDTTSTVVGPRITSLSTSVLAKANDSTVITGKNFASNATVTFTGTDSTVRNAKSVTRNSATSLTVVRPDDLPNSYQPYTITVSNPGVSSPTSTNSNKLSSAITAGSIPVWTTSAGTLADLVVNNSAYSSTLVATDADAGSAVTYSIVSGALPSGLSLNASTGAITGTCTASYTFYNFTVRVTDAGGNYVDRAFAVQNYPASDSDNFNRSAGSLGSTSNKAQIWVTDRGAWYTNGSSAQSDTDPATYPVAHITAPSVNKTTSVSSQPGTGVAFWVQDTNNWWGSVPYYTTGSTTNYVTSCGTLTLGTSANCGSGNGWYYQCTQTCGNGAVRSYNSYGGACENYSNFYCTSRGGFAYYDIGSGGNYGYVNTTNSVVSTNYVTSLKTIRNSGGSISDYDVVQHNTNTSGYVDITSIIVSTSNGVVSITGTASRSFSPGNPSTTATGFGIIKAPGGSRQGSTVDDFSLS
jgi:hypothetical protein